MTSPAGPPGSARTPKPVEGFRRPLSQKEGNVSSGNRPFKVVCDSRRIVDGCSLWGHGRNWNDVAHDVTQSRLARSAAFARKTYYVDQAISVVPDCIDLGDTRLLPQGIVGLHLRGVSGLHVKVAQLSEASRKFVVEKVLMAMTTSADAEPSLRKTNRLPARHGRRSETAA